ncbi:hypothetical protein [uncultured Thiodictyon sp.]|uniref:hypothetical protein n=1 Tax=uncultured Thiodictyon sp. TaxID=1846217 RepID=UPI0025DD2F8A|nr:hypothetical protein [uncultured Thiodictyon sp.]
MRVYVDRRDGRVLGGAMIGPGCEHLAQALAWGVERRLTVRQMVQMPFDHPGVGAALQETLSELVLRLGPTPLNPPALRRSINWPGRSARAPARGGKPISLERAVLSQRHKDHKE